MLCKGIAAAQGFALGRALVKVEETLSYARKTLAADQVAAEVARLKEALSKTNSQLEAIKQKALRDIGEAEAKIFEAHQLFLEDPEFVGAMEGNIENDKVNAEAALEDIRDMFVGMFESMDNEYMRERAADLRDVSQRILKNLLGMEDTLVGDSKEPVILVVHDLTPSDTAQLDKSKVKAFVTNIGGRTSHSAIMARTMEIPAITGLSDITEKVQTGDMLIVDGETGDVYVNPEQELITTYQKKLEEYEAQKAAWVQLINEPSVSKDGHHVELVANIGTPHDAEVADKAGAEGIGLFRTEFLYMGRDNFPTEEEQFESYKAVALTMDNNRPVVIRTLDIGGDKELPYLQLPHEMNPFLGYRAIRICLDQVDLFKTQLRALLRASAFGNIKIMYPMIATLKELRQANAILEEVKVELRDKGIAFNEEIEVGMMIEIPAAAVIADQLAKEADFFSIGTNDLIQYTMACDRMNQQISYLYDPYNPAVLRLIKNVIDAAHKEGKWAGMCGEMAGEEYALPILLGFGLDEFSMSAPSVLRARHMLKQLSYAELKAISEHVLSLESGEEIRDYIKTNVLDKL
ncbi:phosphoenolpyruvate--protein phosphotransferase [Brevibacillus laterosporus]|uniref:Phosphoenolpyruvate-protein phosphotransferase n=1 Tax=Brevibacillus laterosporus TaxID=1465 RepID=A0A502HCW0_BRELA|nr:phosphoenolpyruvate--protein phosphotransferase [Brevibacillus laterosporus]QDX92716.1 phosphoenolpyruvate--protein phosphotransferase [Brevibacillus laterosporus]TPG71030.1 phosphoenolpyruvate--protein phosphotransferase [Brevibacillus laterosporus]TPG74762.1 phosphoenolpyruvate--protein phosphotransferase [Brevibacillus laterosporus]